MSHHHQELAAGAVDPDIDRAVRSSPALIHYSRYAMQVEPWIDAFGIDRVRLVRFESYVQQRRRTVAELCDFLGVPPANERVDAERVYNAGEQLWVRSGLIWRITRSEPYRAWLRPWLSRETRARFRGLLLGRTPRPAPPSLATVDYILAGVRDDVRTLQEMAQWPEPPWDLDEVRARYTVAAE